MNAHFYDLVAYTKSQDMEWAMLTVTFPNYFIVETGIFTITATYDITSNLILNILANIE